MNKATEDKRINFISTFPQADIICQLGIAGARRPPPCCRISSNSRKKPPNAAGTMLDNSVVTNGSPMGSPNQHDEGTLAWE